jgi:hypothetical protein
VEKILDVASPSQKLAFGLAAYAGLRAGEVRGLRWGDVNLEAGIIVVRVSHSHGAISAPKSGYEREIPIAAPLKALLGPPKKKNDLVATTSKGDAWGEYGLLTSLPARAAEGRSLRVALPRSEALLLLGAVQKRRLGPSRPGLGWPLSSGHDGALRPRHRQRP